MRDIDEEYYAYSMEEECLRRRLKHAQTTGNSYMSPAPMSIEESGPILQDEYNFPSGLLRLRNGKLQTGLGMRLTEVEMQRRLLGMYVQLYCKKIFFTITNNFYLILLWSVSYSSNSITKYLK